MDPMDQKTPEEMLADLEAKLLEPTVVPHYILVKRYLATLGDPVEQFALDAAQMGLGGYKLIQFAFIVLPNGPQIVAAYHKHTP